MKHYRWKKEYIEKVLTRMKCHDEKKKKCKYENVGWSKNVEGMFSRNEIQWKKKNIHQLIKPRDVAPRPNSPVVLWKACPLSPTSSRRHSLAWPALPCPTLPFLVLKCLPLPSDALPNHDLPLLAFPYLFSRTLHCSALPCLALTSLAIPDLP